MFHIHAMLTTMSTTIESGGLATDRRVSPLQLSVVIPCLNEAENIERCVTSALGAMARSDIRRRGDRGRQ